MRCLPLAAAVLAFAGAAMADFVIYDPPGIPIVVTLEGKTEKVNRSVKLKTRVWPDELTFLSDTVTIYKSEPPRDKLVKKVKNLVSDKANPTAEELWTAGKEALMAGAPGSLFEVMDAMEKKFPAHEPSKIARTLAPKWEFEIPESESEEPGLRALVAAKPEMKIHRTPHFLILHDVDTGKKKGEKVSRFQRRCNLMERVYKSYLAFLYANGHAVEPPKERMRVVFFNEQADFHAVAEQVMKTNNAKQIAGFYHRTLDASFFYDNASTESYRKMAEASADFEKNKTKYMHGYNPDIIQTLKMFGALKEIIREENDMEVVSHEIIHHVSAATGLMPRDAPCPKWAAEGLATFFESPSDCTWSGIGAVNQRRLDGFRIGVAAIRNQFDIDVLAHDAAFGTAARDFKMMEMAYAHGWSFTHFMMNRRFKQLVGYYKELGKLPRFDLEKLDAKSHAEYERLQESAFKKSFPDKDWPVLAAEWKIYHNGLKTDFERASGTAASRRRPGSATSGGGAKK